MNINYYYVLFSGYYTAARVTAAVGMACAAFAGIGHVSWVIFPKRPKLGSFGGATDAAGFFNFVTGMKQ
jgi:hypothetical protein